MMHSRVDVDTIAPKNTEKGASYFGRSEEGFKDQMTFELALIVQLNKLSLFIHRKA